MNNNNNYSKIANLIIILFGLGVLFMYIHLTGVETNENSASGISKILREDWSGIPFTAVIVSLIGVHRISNGYLEFEEVPEA